MDPITIGLIAAGGLLVARGFSNSTVKAPPPTVVVGATSSAGAGPIDQTVSTPGAAVASVPGVVVPPSGTLPRTTVDSIPPLGGSGGHGPVSGTVAWPPGPGQPGAVTIGGTPAPDNYSLGNMQTAIKASGVAATLAGTTTGIAGALGGGGSAGVAATLGTTAATAIPLVGIGVAAVGLVLGIIAKHHAAAVALEASTLNQAVPIIRQRQVLILQAAIRGEITSLSQADTLITEMISDYYAMVKKIQQGTWHWVVGTSSKNDKAPSGCNGPCVVGHWWIEGDSKGGLHNTIALVLAGAHGTWTIQSIPSNAGFSGMPAIKVVY